MLNERTVVTFESFLKAFDAKFSNFCKKSILSLTYSIIGDVVTITDNSGFMEKTLKKKIDMRPNVGTIIYEIREELIKHYPKFYIYKEKKYLPLEIKQLLKEKTPEEVENITSKSVKTLQYTFIKAIHEFNEINLIDHLDQDKIKSYKLFIPLTVFIDKLYTNIDEAQTVFNKKAIYLKIIGNK